MYRAKYTPGTEEEDVTVLDHLTHGASSYALIAHADGRIETVAFRSLRYVPGEAEFMRDVRALLYLDVDVDGDWWNPDKEWDSATFDALGQLMERYRLVPPERRNDGK